MKKSRDAKKNEGVIHSEWESTHMRATAQEMKSVNRLCLTCTVSLVLLAFRGLPDCGLLFRWAWLWWCLGLWWDQYEKIWSELWFEHHCNITTDYKRTMVIPYFFLKQQKILISLTTLTTVLPICSFTPKTAPLSAHTFLYLVYLLYWNRQFFSQWFHFLSLPSLYPPLYLLFFFSFSHMHTKLSSNTYNTVTVEVFTW